MNKQTRMYKIRKIIFRAFIVFFLLIGIVDFYLETYGLPEWVIHQIQISFSEAGYRMNVNKVYAGFWNGIVCQKLELEGNENNPSLRAELLRIDLIFSRFLKGIFLPIEFNMKQGNLSFPLFPEFGKEGLGDCLEISDFNATLSGIPGKIRISNANGSLNGIHFSMSGTIDNLLHYSGSKGFDALRKAMTGEKDGKIQSVDNEYTAFILRIPLELRRKALFTIQRMNEKDFSGIPSCELRFHLDITDFKKCSAKASFFIPAFQYGNIKIRSIREEITLQDGFLSVQDIQILLEDGSRVIAKGHYDGNGQAANGTVHGDCHLEDIVLFLDDTLQDDIAAHVKFDKERVAFRGTLDNFSLSGKYSGEISFFISRITISNVELFGAKVTLSVDENELKGTLLSAKLKNGGKLSGTFRFVNNIFEVALEGTVPPEEMKHFLPVEISDFIYKNIRFHDSSGQLAFSGTMKSPIRNIKDLTGQFKLQIPRVMVKSIPIEKMEAELQFTGNSVRISSMEALIADGTRISGDLYCLPTQHDISGRIVCSGSPHKLVVALGGAHQEFVRSLTRNIGWPSNDNFVEAAAEIHVDYGKDPFYYMAGSLVVRDFSYEKIPFRYGAARFIIDADNHLILPDAVLETNDGKMSMSASYVPSGKTILSDAPTGRLNFSLNSTMAGNDMIRSLYPQWKSEFIDFPYPVKVESSGVIDYTDSKKTHFNAVISNGSCEWHRMNIRDIDTNLRYQNDTLSFRNASGLFCEGRLVMDYSYDFNSGKGNISTRISGSNLQALLESFAQKKFPAEYKNGTLTANLKADLSYNPKEELLLHGNGGFELTGSNLWTVPILGSFLRIIGQAWSLDNFGAITQVGGDFTLNGDKLTFEKLKSNGGFVSLNANGFYRWERNDFDIHVRAVLLKNTLPFDAMSRLLTPVSWIMEKRLKGDFHTFQWE